MAVKAVRESTGEPARLHVRHRPGEPDRLMDYWVPGVTVTGVHELLANASS